jgi:peptide/nickel transport system ATP-binding protein
MNNSASEHGVRTQTDTADGSDIVLSAREISVEVDGQKSRLFGRRPRITIIDDVSLELEANRTYGLVGESGSGKSTLGRALIGVQEHGSGDIVFLGTRLPTTNAVSERQVRRQVQMIYQNPLGSFDPRQTIRESMAEALRAHGRAADDAVLTSLMDEVGLPHSALDSTPRALSGGQRQRAAIARAISLEPALIVADEPFAALDVTTQARVVALLARLQHERGLTQLVISHDLALMDLICDEIFVLYLGSIVEHAPASVLADRAAHPYTLALRSAIPVPDPTIQRSRERVLLNGDPPSPAARPSGCPFRTRCPFAIEVCATERPPLRSIGSRHTVACHRAEEVQRGGTAAAAAAATSQRGGETR